MGKLIEESQTIAPMSNDEIVENLKTMVFGVQAFERFNAKERETLDKAWNIIDEYENRLKDDMLAILEKIRDEIEGYKSTIDNAISEDELKIEGMKEAYTDALAIIDKYRGDNE